MTARGTVRNYVRRLNIVNSISPLLTFYLPTAPYSGPLTLRTFYPSANAKTYWNVRFVPCDGIQQNTLVISIDCTVLLLRFFHGQLWNTKLNCRKGIARRTGSTENVANCIKTGCLKHYSATTIVSCC